ncbi:MAG TPA: hypothetical protein VG056_04975 [Pirellulales bacterium]|jgi:hypothetical protein|nr:hypothetical protein [Pirellulales bacterium]
MDAPLKADSSVDCANIRWISNATIAAVMSLFAVGIWSVAAIQAAEQDTPNVSAVQSVAHDFDLVPKLLSAAKGRADADPLKTISRRMTVIHGDLSEFETDEPVQTRERQVVRTLDELIAALERHCSGLGRGNVPNGGRKDSVIASGSAAFGGLHGVDPNARQWGQLPPKLRSEILQSKTDGFPPGYEALLQSYYQQLAEEKSLDDKSATAAANDSKPADPTPATK